MRPWRRENPLVHRNNVEFADRPPAPAGTPPDPSSANLGGIPYAQRQAGPLLLQRRRRPGRRSPSAVVCLNLQVPK